MRKLAAAALALPVLATLYVPILLRRSIAVRLVLGLAGRIRTEPVDDHGRPSALAPRPTPAAVLATLGPAESAVAAVLLDGSATVDDLALGANLPVATVLGTLTVLELRGLVSAGGGRYRLDGVLAGAAPVRTATVAPVRQPVLP